MMKIRNRYILNVALCLMAVQHPLRAFPQQTEGGGPGSEPENQKPTDLGDIAKASDIFKHVSKDKGYVTLQSRSKDGLPLTADIYPGASPAATMILLFHQAGSSRGEYRKIAPHLQAKGYNCLALDARSGNGVRWGVTNVTAAHALRRKLDQRYDAARQDLERSLFWVREMEFTGKIVIWGSSYSAALVLLMAQPDADGKKIEAALAFSPGEYLAKKGVVTKAVPRIQVPVFLTCARAEIKDTVAPFAKFLKNKHSKFFLPEIGVHGSRFLTLTDSKNQAMAKDSKEAWKRVFAFLTAVAPPKAVPTKGTPRKRSGQPAGSKEAAATGRNTDPKPNAPEVAGPASRKGRD